MAFKALSSNKIAILLGALSILSGFLWNELNVSYLKFVPNKLSVGKTIVTADDASYLSPVENFLSGKGFKNNLIGTYSYYMRPPGYSILYLGFRFWLPQKEALYALKFFQVLLFGFSVSVLFLLLKEVRTEISTILILCSLYAFSGFGLGFLYYTLTEAITPALLLIFFYCLIKAKNIEFGGTKNRLYILSFMLFGLLFILRPVLGIFVLSVPLFLYQESVFTFRKKLLYSIYLVLFGFGPMLLWQVRAFQLSGKIVGLHPIYSTENSQTPYRPVHHFFWEFAKSWGETGVNFHAYTDAFWKNCYSNPSDTIAVETIVTKIPKSVLTEFGETRIKNAFENYRLAILAQRIYFLNKQPLPKSNFAYERKAIDNFKQLTAEYRTNHIIYYHLIAPFSVFKEMIFHSNLSLHIFQKTYRGNAFMEFWRLMLYVLHSMLFILFPLVIFTKRISKDWRIIFYSVIIYVFYLAYFQRGIEERYTLPILPLLLIAFAFNIAFIKEKLRLIFNTE